MAKLERAEKDLIEDLVQAGELSLQEATLAVVLATRSHARPQDELVEILCQYHGLENRSVVENALKELRRREWVQTTGMDDGTLVHQAPELREKIAEMLQDTSIAVRLTQIRATLDPYLSIVGPMKDTAVYQTFMRHLRNADDEISLPMLATPPYADTVKVLKERAESGVRVRLLLGAPSLVARWRGAPMEKIAEDRIRQWQGVAHANPGIKIRISDSPEYMRLGSCVIIDRRLVRFDVYDPALHRSLEGVMLEVESPSGADLNFVAIIREIFEEAWAAALPPGGLAGVMWRLRRKWKIFGGAIIVAFSVVPVPVPGWREVGLGIASTLLAQALLEAKLLPTKWLRPVRK